MSRTPFLIAGALSAGLFASVTLPASAATTGTQNVDLMVEAGELSLETGAANPISKVKMSTSLSAVHTGFTKPFTVNDYTGAQKGYRLDVAATPVTDGTSTLPTGSISISAPTAITGVNAMSSKPPVKTLTTRKVLDTGAVTVATATVGNGMGSYDIAFATDAVEIHLNPSVKINGATSSTYKSTLTWSLIQAP